MARNTIGDPHPRELRRFHALLLGGTVFWSAAIGVSLFKHSDDERRHTRILAEKEGRANFLKDQAFRLWATGHGGVYVPATERTPPNPYLSHIPERDIVTPSGRRLTLMNPAYMVRQMMEEYSDFYGVRGRITSLKPLNPRNAPDAWEARVLKSFEESDVREVSEVVDMDGKPYLRLMRPMITQKGCLKCHEHQGYRAGDIRGGIGVAVPLAPYLDLQREHLRKDVLLHGALWLIGLTGLGAVGVTGRRNIRARLLREEAESLRHEGTEIKYAVAKALHESDWTFEERVNVALAALAGLAGMAENGGAEITVIERGKGRRGFRHARSFRHSAGKPTPEAAVGELRVIPLCDQPDMPPHGHYVVSLDHAGEQIGVLAIDTLPHPPDHAAHLDVLRQIGDIFALAVLNDRAERLLRDAMARAEAASLSKSQFLATMSHEIRTPMNGILGMAQLLLMPELTEAERQEYARTIANSGQTLLALLNDILDLSKIEAGKLAMAHAAFDPEQVIRENVAIFAESARAKGLSMEAAWRGPAGRRYLADPIRLRQMLSNLVANAIKFTSKGFVRVEAAEIESGDGRALLEFSVADSGIGIPADKQSLLFQPFSQVDGSVTREYGGTGLGLSIVGNLARLMGGGVGVESEAGKGSRFWFRIRADRLPEGQESRHVQRGAAGAGRPAGAASGLAGRVLVVEDNPANRKVIEAMVGKFGLAIECAGNGREAVDAVTAGSMKPDLVLMDVQMPEMDGIEATARIREWERENGRPRLAIVALTASAFEEDRRRCLDSGMDDFLAKPLNMDELAAVLAKWLGSEA